MKLIKFFFVALLLSANSLLAQNTDQVKKKGPADTYARSSLSYLLLDFPNENYMDEVKQAIYQVSVPSKFDSNNLKYKIMKASYPHNNTMTISKKSNSVSEAMVSNDYPLKIVKYWWGIKDNGTYNTHLIEKRGFYNATDENVEKVDATKVGRTKLADSGLKLIGNSYVLVLDYHDIKTMTEIYDKQDAKGKKLADKLKTEFVPVERIKNGYTGKLTAFLYKLNYTDTIQGYFYDAFKDDNTLDMNKFNQIYKNVNQAFKLVFSETTKVDGTQSNPGQPLAPLVQKSKQKLMVKLVNSGILKVIGKMEKNIESFRVKTPLVETHPLGAKIGKKEGLTQDRRYFVWQYIQKNNGSTVARRKGVVRAGKVIDNRNNELGKTDTSIFYQVAGSKLKYGMTLQERKDFGLGLAVGYSPSNTGGTVIHIDLNVGQLLDFPIKQFKLYADIAFQTKEYDVLEINLPTGPIDYSFTRFSIGIQKEYYFARNFIFAWDIGYGGETANWPNAADGEKVSVSGITFGGRFGMNLTHSIQAFASITKYSAGKASYFANTDDKNGTEIEAWSTIFPDRTGMSFDLSLRLLF